MGTPRLAAPRRKRMCFPPPSPSAWSRIDWVTHRWRKCSLLCALRSFILSITHELWELLVAVVFTSVWRTVYSVKYSVLKITPARNSALIKSRRLENRESRSICTFRLGKVNEQTCKGLCVKNLCPWRSFWFHSDAINWINTRANVLKCMPIVMWVTLVLKLQT